MSNTEKNKSINLEDSGEISINFSEIFQALNKFKLIIAIIALLFGGVGAIYSLTLNNEYSSVVKLLPETNQVNNKSTNLGGLAGLVGLAGINIGEANSNVDIINPSLLRHLGKDFDFDLYNWIGKTMIDRSVFLLHLAYLVKNASLYLPSQFGS